MKKETKKKLKDIYWILIHSLAFIGLIYLGKYLIYGTIY
jgi:hypothetical protein